MIERVFDPGRRLGAVGDSNHNRRRCGGSIIPVHQRLAPVISKQVITIHDQIRQRFPRESLAVQVVLALRDRYRCDRGAICTSWRRVSRRLGSQREASSPEPDSIASFRPKSLTIQPNNASSELCLPEGVKGVAEKS